MTIVIEPLSLEEEFSGRNRTDIMSSDSEVGLFDDSDADGSMDGFVDDKGPYNMCTSDPGVSDAMEKCLKLIQSVLLQHWHIRDGEHVYSYQSLVHCSQLVHVLDDDDWVNEAYEGPEKDDVYSLWLMKVQLKQGCIIDFKRLGGILRESLAADFGSSLDCLFPAAVDGSQFLRIRMLVGKWRGFVTVLNQVLRSLAAHRLSLPSALPTPLPTCVVRRIQAAISDAPVVQFRVSEPLQEEALKAIFGQAGSVVRLHSTKRAAHGATFGLCEFQTVVEAAKAMHMFDGRELAGGLFGVKRCL